MAKKRQEDPAWVKANNDRYLAKYPERWKARKHAYYLKNKEKWAPHLVRYRTENPEKCAAAIRAWGKKNPDKIRAAQQRHHSKPEVKLRNCVRQNARNARKLRAIPKWADVENIQKIYEFAAFMTTETGERWEVDHTVPLISPTVCGLHCETNLLVVPAAENRSKGNRFWANMW